MIERKRRREKQSDSHVEELIIAEKEPPPVPRLEPLRRPLEQIALELIYRLRRRIGRSGICGNNARETVLGKLADARVPVLHRALQLHRFRSHQIYLESRSMGERSGERGQRRTIATYVVAHAAEELLVIGAQIEALVVERVAGLIVVQKLQRQGRVRAAAGGTKSTFSPSTESRASSSTAGWSAG